VRIGVDMLGVQSRESRGRGIGRYARSLISTLLPLDPSVEYLLYSHPDLPTDDFPNAPNAAVRHLAPGANVAESIDRLAQVNPDGLDVLLLLSPFELHGDYDPPARPLNGPAMSAVLYDLVPFLFQEKYLTWPPAARRFYRNLERLRTYDALLAISEATRDDGRKLLGRSGDRIVNISAASDPAFFTPDRSDPMPRAVRADLDRLGIDRPFVFCLGSTDERKNLLGLIDAFRLLPESTRSAHQLVVACALPPEHVERLRRHAETRGVADSLVLTGQVSDETLRTLYRRCVLFALPSLYEGFGLPLLEAMHCGAAVVGGKNSSQVEVVGDAGLLANVHDAGDIAAKLSAILDDPALAASLRARAPEQAGRFSWEGTASRALEALAGAARRGRRTRRLRVDRAHGEGPRIAIVSPWPPKATGVADYAWRLARELRRHYAVDLYHDAGYEPDLGRDGRDFGCYDHRLFARNAAVRGYRGVLFQMGNSYYHRFVYEALRAHRGIVTLHDFNLANFHHWFAYAGGASPDHLVREAEHSSPGWGEQVGRHIDEWIRDEGVQEAFARRGLALNRRVFEHAAAVVVHSPWCLDRVQADLPEHLDRTSVIPHGASPMPVSPEHRAAIRDRFEIPRNAIVAASFGILHPGKMNLEALDAFAALARSYPSALLLFVGKDLTGGEVRRKAEALGLAGRVRFFGQASDADFLDLVAATDLGICLRRPPTNGETSGALLHLLRHGVAAVVSDVGTFADYPDDVVRKVPWDPDDLAGLSQALLDLADRRDAFGRAALDHVARHHDWPLVAEMYADLIERCPCDKRADRPHYARGARSKGTIS
jgi:glycosyltransferase involved in cell wall biosynthesis